MGPLNVKSETMNFRGLTEKNEEKQRKSSFRQFSGIFNFFKLLFYIISETGWRLMGENKFQETA